MDGKNYWDCIYDQVRYLILLIWLVHLFSPYFYLYFRDANTIFRGNSLATRCLDEMMKIVGGHYLKVTLKPILDEVRSEYTYLDNNSLHGLIASVSFCDLLMEMIYPFMYYLKNKTEHIRSKISYLLFHQWNFTQRTHDSIIYIISFFVIGFLFNWSFKYNENFFLYYSSGILHILSLDGGLKLCS